MMGLSKYLLNIAIQQRLQKHLLKGHKSTVKVFIGFAFGTKQSHFFTLVPLKTPPGLDVIMTHHWQEELMRRQRRRRDGSWWQRPGCSSWWLRRWPGCATAGVELSGWQRWVRSHLLTTTTRCHQLYSPPVLPAASTKLSSASFLKLWKRRHRYNSTFVSLNFSPSHLPLHLRIEMAQ